MGVTPSGCSRPVPQFARQSESPCHIAGTAVGKRSRKRSTRRWRPPLAICSRHGARLMMGATPPGGGGAIGWSGGSASRRAWREGGSLGAVRVRGSLVPPVLQRADRRSRGGQVTDRTREPQKCWSFRPCDEMNEPGPGETESGPSPGKAAAVEKPIEPESRRNP
jgi:hypothetical protein